MVHSSGSKIRSNSSTLCHNCSLVRLKTELSERIRLDHDWWLRGCVNMKVLPNMPYITLLTALLAHRCPRCGHVGHAPSHGTQGRGPGLALGFKVPKARPEL